MGKGCVLFCPKEGSNKLVNAEPSPATEERWRAIPAWHQGTAPLITALPALSFCCQPPVPRAETAVRRPFVEPGSVHRRG
jgi:hypothetical protein